MKTTQKNTFDFVIIGAGIVGTTIALELKKRHPDQSIAVIDKESAPGKHGSGRNSGVIHAGFYYSADTLKAKFTRVGSERLRTYCEQKKLALNKCGKLVIAKNETELKTLQTLFERGAKNGVELKDIDEKTALEIEPRVKVFGNRALFSPNTASANPKEVLNSMQKDAAELGIKFIFDCKAIRKLTDKSIRTSQGEYHYSYLVNAAGLYADQIAHQYGFGLNYRIMPFKGLYLYSNEEPGAFRTNIYPVPNINNPFLGVHFTLTVDGHVKIGPTAIPAFWREQYQGLENFSAGEFGEIAVRGLKLLFVGGMNFGKLAVEEFQNLAKSNIVEKAKTLANGVNVKDFEEWGPAGIRAQLLDIRTYTLEMDFKIENDDRTLHVLNAVSPGWTCSLPFAEYVVDHIPGVQKSKEVAQNHAPSTRMVSLT